jgi:hypothetical protein
MRDMRRIDGESRQIGKVGAQFVPAIEAMGGNKRRAFAQSSNQLDERMRGMRVSRRDWSSETELKMSDRYLLVSRTDPADSQEGHSLLERKDQEILFRYVKQQVGYFDAG